VVTDGALGSLVGNFYEEKPFRFNLKGTKRPIVIFSALI